MDYSPAMMRPKCSAPAVTQFQDLGSMYETQKSQWMDYSPAMMRPKCSAPAVTQFQDLGSMYEIRSTEWSKYHIKHAFCPPHKVPNEHGNESHGLRTKR
jgi:rubredoxin